MGGEGHVSGSGGVQDIQVWNSGVQGIRVNGLMRLNSGAARGGFRTNKNTFES